MANSPVTNYIPTFYLSTGLPAASYYMKAYQAGAVSTPVTTYTTAADTTGATKYQLNALGQPASGGDTFAPHYRESVDVWIFPTLAEVDANDTSNAIKVIEASTTRANNTDIIFETVAAMVADTGLQVGDHVRTLGYAAIGDGGGNDYDIVAAATGTDDGGSYIDLDTHQAKGLFPNGINAAQFGVVPGSDKLTEMNKAIIFAANNVLTVPANSSSYLFVGNLTSASPITIKAYGATLEWQTNSNNQGFLGTSSNIKIFGGHWKGPQKAALDNTQIGIKFQGANSSSYISSVCCMHAEVSNWGGQGIETLFCEMYGIADNNIHDNYYAGVQDLSGRFALLTRNKVKDIIADGVAGTNAYGIATTKNNGTEAVYPVPHDIIISENVVKNIKTWEGIDTHGGYKINVENNILEDCRAGIAIVSYDSTPGSETNPARCVVVGNQVRRNPSVVADADTQRGILFAGNLAATAGTGCVCSDNTVVGYGSDSATPSTATGAIEVQHQDGIVIANNQVRACQASGILTFSCINLDYHDNYIQSSYGSPAVAPSGTITFTVNPSDGDTITINTAVFTFRNSPSGNYEIQIEVDLLTTLSTTATDLNNSTDGRVMMATYGSTATTVTVTADTVGRALNNFGFQLAASVATTANLSGGTYDAPCGMLFDSLSGGVACTGIVHHNTLNVGTRIGLVGEGDHPDLNFQSNRHNGSGPLYDFAGSTSTPQGGCGYIINHLKPKVSSVVGNLTAGASSTMYIPAPGMDTESLINVSADRNMETVMMSTLAYRNYIAVEFNNVGSGAVNLATTAFRTMVDKTQETAVTVLSA